MNLPEIKRTSRVEFSGPGGAKMFGLVYKRTGNNLQIISDDGNGFSGTLHGVKLSNEPMTFDHPSKRFGPGDRIEFKNKAFEGSKAGTVVKVDMFGRMQVNTDDGGRWDVWAMNAQASQKPAPKNSAQKPASYAKGDRVEWTDKGTTRYGVVSKGGSRKIEVIHDGGEHMASGSVSVFSLSDHPLKTDGPDAMDRWTLVNYKAFERMSEETTCFNAKVALNGKPVIEASNDGRGGCNMYRRLPGAPADVCDQLEADATAWRARLSGREFDRQYHENADQWIEWKADKQPYGVTGADYWAEFDRLLPPEPTSPAM
ncbi:hypothetical protein ACVIGB_001136 [Bradyrhizobium sp. USDA 4341]